MVIEKNFFVGLRQLINFYFSQVFQSMRRINPSISAVVFDEITLSTYYVLDFIFLCASIKGKKQETIFPAVCKLENMNMNCGTKYWC
jgi:hypothetical protein